MMKVITANTLKTGEVVFLGAEGWVSTLSSARLFDSEQGLEEVMREHDVADHVVGVYAIDVERRGGDVVAQHIREKIRATGPGNYDHQRVGDTSAMGS